ncbi:hypothetical protein GN956_G18912 [Arapaima gigas]
MGGGMNIDFHRSVLTKPVKVYRGCCRSRCHVALEQGGNGPSWLAGRLRSEPSLGTSDEWDRRARNVP